MHRYGNDASFRSATVALGLEDGTCRMEGNAPAEVRPAFEKIEGWMRFLGYPDVDVFAVKLALHEAVANAFQHGNRNDPSKRVRITYMVTPTEVLAEVQDQGAGFDPRDTLVPHLREHDGRPNGRGLFLMQAYVSWVCFNPWGTSVILCRFRTPDDRLNV